MASRSANSRRLPLWLGWATLCAVLAADATQAQSVLATVDRSQVSIEDQILLKIRVEGAAVAPQLPPLPDFRVVERGHEQHMEFVNGRTSSSVTFNYILIPRSLGTFEIGPALVEVDGKRLQSRPFSVKVVEASEDPLPSRDYYLTARVSKSEPFVGEQIIYTWRFYRRVAVRNARLAVLEFGDLVAEDLGEVREFDTTVNGVQYRVSEIRKALFSQRPGTVAIPPSELNIDVPSQRRRRLSVFDLGSSRWQTKGLRTRPVELEVRPLPAGPAGFSGLVGDFDISADLSKKQLSVGESSTLAITVSGTGNVQMANAPDLPELESFKSYDDKPTGSIDQSGTRLKGRKTFRKALVPLTPGAKELPPVELVFFDPDKETYQTRRTRPLAMDVSPAEGEEELMLTESLSSSSAKRSVRILADDLLPIRRGLDALRSELPSGWAAATWASSGVAPPILYLGLLGYLKRRRRFELDRDLRRRQVALKRARAHLARLGETSGPAGDPKAFAREASLCLRTYIGDMHGREGAALTPDECCAALSGGADEATCRRVREVLDRYEAAQYGASDRAGVRRSEQLENLDGLLRDLDRQLRSRS